jgi:hypothetical protein
MDSALRGLLADSLLVSAQRFEPVVPRSLQTPSFRQALLSSLSGLVERQLELLPQKGEEPPVVETISEAVVWASLPPVSPFMQRLQEALERRKKTQLSRSRVIRAEIRP